MVSFASKQYGTGYDDIGCRMFGPEGTIDTHYSGLVLIIGQQSYKGGRTGTSTTSGAVQNIADFHANITKGDCQPYGGAERAEQPDDDPGPHGRLQAGEVTWDEMMKAAEKLEFPRAGLKD